MMSVSRNAYSALLVISIVLMGGCSTTSKGEQIQRFAFNESPSKIAEYLKGQPVQKAGVCVDVMKKVKKQAVMNNSPLGTQRLLKTKSKNYLANEVDRYTQYHAAWKAYFDANATQADKDEAKKRRRKSAILSGLRGASESIAPKPYKSSRKADKMSSDPVAECAIPVVRAKKQLNLNDPLYVVMGQEDSVGMSKGLRT